MRAIAFIVASAFVFFLVHCGGTTFEPGPTDSGVNDAGPTGDGSNNEGLCCDRGDTPCSDPSVSCDVDAGTCTDGAHISGIVKCGHGG